MNKLRILEKESEIEGQMSELTILESKFEVKERNTCKSNLVIYDARPLSEKDVSIFAAAFNINVEHFLLRPEQLEYPFFPRRVKKYVEINHQNELVNLDKNLCVVSSKEDILIEAKQQGYSTAIYYSIMNAEVFHKAVKELSKCKYQVAFIELRDETNIPLELIIAETQGSKVKIIKKVRTSEDADIAMGIIEVGTDGILLSSSDIKEINGLSKYTAESKSVKLMLKPAIVKGVKYIGMGYRSCIDTTSLMTQQEGMLIGSTSFGGIFICSETYYLQYMNFRPFRVNAGAIHSYIWGPNDKAEYINDLKCGSQILCVDINGNTRVVTVGRVKTEVRPLLLIEAEIEGRNINVILQDDWHIRVMMADRKDKNITRLKVGDEMLGCLFEPGRHMGVRVKETIEEK